MCSEEQCRYILACSVVVWILGCSKSWWKKLTGEKLMVDLVHAEKIVSPALECEGKEKDDSLQHGAHYGLPEVPWTWTWNVFCWIDITSLSFNISTLPRLHNFISLRSHRLTRLIPTMFHPVSEDTKVISETDLQHGRRLMYNKSLTTTFPQLQMYIHNCRRAVDKD